MSAEYPAGREYQANSPKLDGKGGEGVLYIGELGADLEMELLDPEYIAVEDLIERGDDGLSSTPIMSNHSGLWIDRCSRWSPPRFH